MNARFNYLSISKLFCFIPPNTNHAHRTTQTKNDPSQTTSNMSLNVRYVHLRQLVLLCPIPNRMPSNPFQKLSTKIPQFIHVYWLRQFHGPFLLIISDERYEYFPTHAGGEGDCFLGFDDFVVHSLGYIVGLV